MGARLTLERCDIRLRELETRLPFNFGIATMRRLPHCFVSCELDVAGESTTGLAAEHFPPRWFTKDPSQEIEEEVAALLEVVEHACEVATGVGGSTPFACWEQIYREQAAWGKASPHPPLLWAFGVTLVERALLDGFCRSESRSFHEALHAGELGITLGSIYPTLKGVTPVELLPAEPSTSITIRHTVGSHDPLTERPADAPDDGLPVTLVEAIDYYGLDRFKIKLTGDVAYDQQRMRSVLTVLEQACQTYAYTLDANEQYESVEALRKVITATEKDEAVGHAIDDLLFVEQPFPREISLTERVGAELANWSQRPPIVIDESDGELTSFGRALALGYDGTSFKSCKGVFKGIANACLAAARTNAGDKTILSGEDLSTIGPVGLLQDLHVMTTLGIEHVERNGHHYFRGLSMFDADIQDAMRSNHEGCYRDHPDGYPTLAITDGNLDLTTVLNAPFGYDPPLDVTRYDAPATWSFTPPE